MQKANQSHKRVGRYKWDDEAATPGELPREGRQSRQVHVMHGTVPDPDPFLKGKRQRVAINRLTDALEYEHSRDTISEDAYRAGRVFQFIVESSRIPVTGQGQWNPGGSVDQVISHELTILHRIGRAEDVVEMLRDCRQAIGQLGEKVLMLTLIDGLTVKEVALRHGRANSADVYFWGETFRRTLEALADHWASPRSRTPN